MRRPAPGYAGFIPAYEYKCDAGHVLQAEKPAREETLVTTCDCGARALRHFTVSIGTGRGIRSKAVGVKQAPGGGSEPGRVSNVTIAVYAHDAGPGPAPAVDIGGDVDSAEIFIKTDETVEDGLSVGEGASAQLDRLYVEGPQTGARNAGELDIAEGDLD